MRCAVGNVHPRVEGGVRVILGQGCGKAGGVVKPPIYRAFSRQARYIGDLPRPARYIAIGLFTEHTEYNGDCLQIRGG